MISVLHMPAELAEHFPFDQDIGKRVAWIKQHQEEYEMVANVIVQGGSAHALSEVVSLTNSAEQHWSNNVNVMLYPDATSRRDTTIGDVIDFHGDTFIVSSQSFDYVDDCNWRYQEYA